MTQDIVDTTNTAPDFEVLLLGHMHVLLDFFKLFDSQFRVLTGEVG